MKIIFIIVIKIKWGWGKQNQAKLNSLNQKGEANQIQWNGYAKLQSFGPVTASVGAQKLPHRKERVGAGEPRPGPDAGVSPAPVSSQRKRSRLSDTSVQSLPSVGLPSPVPLRTVPDPKKVEASLRHGCGDGGQWWYPATLELSEWLIGSGWASVLNTQSSGDSTLSSENRR